ncbi:hypothetical protein [Oceanobacillus locisalsi]|uniref:Uncharacterized protein n=1 Tax=Oceanobacillus locisalsi TaxID=546107 RepID=A0ABW3NGS4_9BACI
MKKISKLFLASLAMLVAFGSISPSLASAHEGLKTNKTAESTEEIITNEKVAESTPDNDEVEDQGIAWVTKKVLINGIRYGGTALGNLVKKVPYKWADKAGDAFGRWGNKAANAIEKVDDWSQSSIELALISTGIPPADAIVMAKFIAFFI